MDTTTRERELEREYRARRQAIIDGTDKSWEKKMREIKALWEHYRRKLEEAA